MKNKTIIAFGFSSSRLGSCNIHNNQNQPTRTEDLSWIVTEYNSLTTLRPCSLVPEHQGKKVSVHWYLSTREKSVRSLVPEHQGKKVSVHWYLSTREKTCPFTHRKPKYPSTLKCPSTRSRPCTRARAPCPNSGVGT